MVTKEFFRRAPFIRLVIPLMAGITFRLLCPVPQPFVLLSIVITVLAAFCFTVYPKLSVNFRWRWVFGLSVNGFAFLLGVCLTTQSFAQADDEIKESSVKAEVIGVITEPPEFKPRSVQCFIQVEERKARQTFVKCSGKVLVYIQKDSNALNLRAGDAILLSSVFGKIRSSGNPFDFDYSKYMIYQGIRLSGFVDKDSWKSLSSGHLPIYKKWAFLLRDKLLAIFPDLGMKGDELGVASALIVGDKSNLDSEIKRAYVASGTMHILAVSGMHIALLFWVLNMGLFFLDRIKHGKFLKLTILLLAVWLYAMITGLSGSVLRAAAMITFVILGRSFSRNVDIFNSLAASAFVLLVFNPFNLVDAGFQLSYVAVISIVVFYPMIYAWLTVTNKWLDWIWQLVAVTLAAQIVTTPISLYYFHQFPNLFMASNLLMIPISTVIMYLALAIIPLSGIPWLIAWLGKVFNFWVWMLNAVVLYIESLPFALTTGIYINLVDVCLLYLFVILLTYYLVRKRAVFLISCLVALFLFLGHELFEKYRYLKSSEMIVYNDKDNIILQLRNGPESTWLVKHSCTHLPKFMNIATDVMRTKENHVFQLDSLKRSTQNQGERISEGIWVRGNCIQFYNERIVIPDSLVRDQSSVIPLNTDFLLLGNLDKRNEAALKRYHVSKSLIVLSNVSEYKMQRVTQGLTNPGAKIWSVVNNGAFRWALSNQ